MSFSRRTTTTLLLAVLLFTVVSRYPLVEHERLQTDSYFIHMLSDAIIRDGQAVWMFHPLSYFGYYPFSYPSGGPFLLSETSLATGLSVETAIWISGLMIGVLFALTVFCLAREIIRTSGFVILATFFAVVGPRFIDSTYWVGSSRGLAVVLIILAIFIFLRFATLRSGRLIGVGFLILITVFAVHHMAVLLIVFAVAYVLAALTYRYLNHVTHTKRTIAVGGFYAVVSAAIMIIAFAYFDVFWLSIEGSFRYNYVFSFEPNKLSTLLNMLASYTHQVGFASVFAVLFIPSVFRRILVGSRRLLPMSIILLLVPVLGNSLYVSMLISPFIAVMAGLWFAKEFSRGRRRRRIVTVILCAVVSSSFLLATWSVREWNSNEYVGDYTVEVNQGYFDDAVYMRDVCSDGSYAISNSQNLAYIFAAVSGVDSFIVGISWAVNGDVNYEDIVEGIRWSDAPFPKNLYRWFYYEDEHRIYIMLRAFLYTGVGYLYGTSDMSELARNHFSNRSNVLFVIDNEWPSSIVGAWGIFPASIYPQIRDGQWTVSQYGTNLSGSLQSYGIYQSQRVSYYAVSLPVPSV